MQKNNDYNVIMKLPVNLNRISSFLPNSPVSNDDMELYLGMVDGEPSKVKPIILRQNGIKIRYYALTKKSGNNAYQCGFG